MHRTYLSLGSNLGDREKALQEAILHLHSPDLQVVRASPVYETSPQDMPNQSWFLNMVLEAETDLLPMRLLLRVANLERKMGRRRIQNKGPRAIDIDILLYGNFVMRTAQLTIPHASMHERRFVLQPLSDLAPDLRHPVNRRTVREMLGATLGQAVRKADYSPELPPRQTG